MDQGLAKVEHVSERLTLIGTVHVDPKAAIFVRDLILKTRPAVVALELDHSRLVALENPGRAKPSGAFGTSYLGLVLLEKFAGQVVGSAPGREMLGALEGARSVGARVEMIDLPVSTTIAGLRALPWSERLRIAVDSLAGVVALPFGRGGLKEVMENVQEEIRIFRARYPRLSRLLLDDREAHMVERLQAILDMSSGLAVAVVGLGHLEGLKKGLRSYTPRTAYNVGVSWTQPS